MRSVALLAKKLLDLLVLTVDSRSAGALRAKHGKESLVKPFGGFKDVLSITSRLVK